MAGAQQARVFLRVALEWNSVGQVCVIGRSMNIRSAWAGLELHLK